VSRAHGAPRRRLIFLCGVLPVLVVAVFAIYRPAMLTRADDSTYDTVVRSAVTNAPGTDIVIVDVDERSLSSVGQWPWRRDVVGRLITRLRDAGASVIALDIIFAEADGHGQIGDAAGQFAGPTASTPDAELARALRQGHVILGYGLTFDATSHGPRPCVLHPIGIAIVQPPGETEYEPLFHASGAVCNLPALSEAAGASGFLNAAPDSDGILRRVPLLAEFDGRVYPGLALAAVVAAKGGRHVALRISNLNASLLTIDDRTVPLDGKGNLLVRYRGRKGTFPRLSAAAVLAGEIPAGALREKIVFVGTTALGTREVVATPLDTLFAGVEVQATVADNLLQQDFIRRSSLGAILDAVVVLVAGIAMAVTVARGGIVAGLLSAAVGGAGIWWITVWLLSTRGLFVSPLPPMIAVLAALGAMTLSKFTVERGRADEASRDKTAAQGLMVQALLSLTEVRDAETGRHSRRTQQYARLLAEQLSTQAAFRAHLTTDRIDLLSSLAPLHDIGKVGIPDHILNKPGPLTQEELAEMRKHPALGRDVILKAEARVGVRDDATLQMAKEIVYTHHERWDGTGYPQGLRGADIPVAGRVMALVDVYDATRARALYRKCMSHEETVELIVSGRNTHFDPSVVDAFLSVSARFKSLSDEAPESQQPARPDDQPVCAVSNS
jgi:HD-GYP domain-containing protein (c-di-GMP phosphodiesterase class II)